MQMSLNSQVFVIFEDLIYTKNFCCLSFACLFYIVVVVVVVIIVIIKVDLDYVLQILLPQ